eukprot:11679435-Alexandrium_andersonii.AAC.1
MGACEHARLHIGRCATFARVAACRARSCLCSPRCATHVCTTKPEGVPKQPGHQSVMRFCALGGL